MEDTLVRRRTELKFRLGGAEADLLAASLPAALHRRVSEVATVYLDHADGRLLRAVRRDARLSVKIRLRSYEAAEGRSGLWLEFKTREGDESRKRRFPLAAGLVPDLLAGRLRADDALRAAPQADPDEVAAVLAGIRDAAAGRLEVAGEVRYRRESFEGGRPRARLTIDRGVLYRAGGRERREEGAVVELKRAAERTPPWCAVLLDGRTPAEYSKFRALAGLLPSEAAAR
jgi:hypothetical protein